ncbi:hypothetical protein Hanom_Chr14g01321721 [Helianthus anomalus]
MSDDTEEGEIRQDEDANSDQISEEVAPEVGRSSPQNLKHSSHGEPQEEVEVSKVGEAVRSENVGRDKLLEDERLANPKAD